MNKHILVAVAAVLAFLPASAQLLQVQSMEQVALPQGLKAEQAILSPDGSLIALSDMAGTLKLVDRNNGTARTISNNGSMMDLAFNQDGTALVYREATTDANHLRHVAVNNYVVATGMSHQIAAPSRNLQAIRVEGNIATTVDNGRLAAAAISGNRIGAPAAPTNAPVPSIDRGHLYLTVNGERTLCSPLGTTGMSYLWPSVSPDGTKLLFFAAGYGTYTCNLDGSNLTRLGWLYAPVWYDNETIVAMKTRDNGRVTYEGAIIAAAADGSATQTLTDPGMIAVFPDTAPGRISFTTTDGQMYILKVNKL